MSDLDNTSITGLRNTLKSLRKDLSATKPGTSEWQDLADKIKTVEHRIKELNEKLGDQPSFWAKIQKAADKVWPVFDIISRVYAHVKAKMGEYVETYASMDSAMANTQKFTGMTRDQVESLNEEFKKMDTRTSREGLNELVIKRISRKSMTCGLLTFLSG